MTLRHLAGIVGLAESAGRVKVRALDAAMVVGSQGPALHALLALCAVSVVKHLAAQDRSRGIADSSLRNQIPCALGAACILVALCAFRDHVRASLAPAMCVLEESFLANGALVDSKVKVVEQTLRLVGLMGLAMIEERNTG